jgi:hypothetical protein
VRSPVLLRLGSGWLLFLRTGFTERATVRAKIASWLRKQSKATYRPSNRSRTGWTVASSGRDVPLETMTDQQLMAISRADLWNPFRQLNSGGL